MIGTVSVKRVLHSTALLSVTLLATGGTMAAAQIEPKRETTTQATAQPAQPVAPLALPLPRWRVQEARALLAAINGAAAVGLRPADYAPDALRTAIEAGAGEELDRAARQSFVTLASHMRDGRTPLAARIDWYVKDTDAETMPMSALLERAATQRDVAGALASVEPTHANYRALKTAFAAAPATDTARRHALAINMDRWRWMPQDLSSTYLLGNVPEYLVRVVERINGVDTAIATHRTVVGRADTATPSLDANATGIIINPPWYLPQSIVRGEVGPMIRRNPAAARARGYSWTGTGENLSVVQKAGPGNALGMMKLDMPNPHAIFFHDTPSRSLFSQAQRTFSHGCLRTDRAVAFSGMLAIRYGGISAEHYADLVVKGKTERVAFTTPFKVFITYMTMGPGENGGITRYNDPYRRDTALIATLARAGRPVSVVDMPPPAPSTPTTATPPAQPMPQPEPQPVPPPKPNAG